MTERRKRLTEKLNEIDAHIESGEPLHGGVERPLQEAIGGVRQVLDAADDEDENHEELTEALGDIALKLEVSHPKLTELLNHVSEILAGTGF